MARASSLEEIFENAEAFRSRFNPEKAEGVDAVFQFNATGGGGRYWARVRNKQIEIDRGEHASPDLIMTASHDDLLALFNGELNPMTAFIQGKIKIKGDMTLAMKLQLMLGLG